MAGLVHVLRRAAALRGPEAYQTLVALGLALVVEVGVRVVPLPRLAMWLGVPLHTEGASSPLAEVALAPWAVLRLRAVSRVMRRWPFGDTCLRRCLVAGHRIRALHPCLRIGVSNGEGAFLAHAWLEVGGTSLDPRSASFAPLHAR